MVELPKRIEEKIERIPIGGCWIWIGASSGRYGNVNISGKSRLAHRVVWEIINGQISEGNELLHSCDNGHCVNPAHLMEGTHLDNMQDMKAKGRARSQCGDNHWTRINPDKAREIATNNIRHSHHSGELNNNAKIDAKTALMIREEHARSPSLTYKTLGDMFGIKKSQVGNIIRGESW